MKAQTSQHWDVYRNYTENQTEDLIYYRYKEQLSAAARKAGSNERTARNMLKKYEDDDEYKRCDDTH